jgi:hypothetical protein
LPYFSFEVRVRFEHVKRLAKTSARLSRSLQPVERNAQVIRDVNRCDKHTEHVETLGRRLQIRYGRILLPEKGAEFV